MNSEPRFSVNSKQIASWNISVVELDDEARHLAVSVLGIIANSVPTSPKGKLNLANWKIQIASAIKAARGDVPWDSSHEFAITLGLCFCPSLHGGRHLDVENFVKPIVDALAAGLFCSPDTDPSANGRFDFDDSNFNTLLIQRLPNTTRPDCEGAVIHVSTK